MLDKILTVVTFLPLGAAVCIFLFCRGADEAAVARNARWTALFASGFVFLLSLLIFQNFQPGTAEFQFLEEVPWLPDYGINYKMGVDGISVLFVLLTTLLTPICILASWEAIQSRVKEYMIAFLVLRPCWSACSAPGSGRLLHLLRGRPDSDVPDHRSLGRRAGSTRPSSSSSIPWPARC